MKKAFTLVELMVVIAVIGILAAALLPNIGNVVDKAQAAKIISEYQSLSTASTAYKTDCGRWPKFWNTDGAIWTMLDNRRGYDQWNGPYIRRPSIRGGRIANQFGGQMMLEDVNNGFGDDWWCWQAPCAEWGVIHSYIPANVQVNVEIALDGRNEGAGNGEGKVKRFWGDWIWLVIDAGQQWDGW